MDLGYLRRMDVSTAGRRSLGERGRSAVAADDRGDGVSARAIAEVLAILMVDLVGVLPISDKAEALQRLANRLSDQSQPSVGKEVASLIAMAAAALMRLEI